MPKNFVRAALALAKAALNAQQASAPPKPAAPSTRKRRVSTGRAMLLGAGLAFAGQALVKSRGREVLDSVRHGLAEKIDSNDEDELDAHGDDDFDEQPDAEDDQDFDDGSAGDQDQEFDQEDDEYYDEPEGEEDQEPDQEDDEDEGPARSRSRRKAASGRGRS
jgi:hypothetical protein